jgi:nitrite reductase/ring-hydroxylating ferredoxin subunit
VTADVPQPNMQAAGQVTLARTDELPPGARKRILVAGRAIMLINAEGDFYALDAECTHRKAPLDKGAVRGRTIVCPWHKGTFDLETGAPLTPPVTTPVKTYPVTVSNGQIQVLIEE